MLYRRSINRFIFISLALMGLSVSSASAVSLNIDIGSIRASAGLSSAYGAAAGQAGVWNQISTPGTTSGLLDLSGFSTRIDLSLTGSSIYLEGNRGGASNDVEYLLNDFFFADPSSDWSMTLSNMDQGTYNIYYYAPAATNVSTGAFSINGNSVTSLPGENGASQLVQGVSWGVLSNVSVGSLGLMTLLPANTSGFRGLAGLQIVSVSAAIFDPAPPPLSSVVSPVPAPPAVWLFGTALIGMIGSGKRCKAA